MTELPSLLILTFSPIRSDPRVLKQVELFKEKYRVSTCAYGGAPDGVEEHYPLPEDSRGWPSDKLGLVSRQYAKVYNGLPAVKSARALLPKGRFDIILANDLNTLPLALDLEPRLGVHSDLHEFAPREKEDNLKWRLFIAPFMRWLCSRYLAGASSVTSVSQGIADEYFKDYGTPTGVVTNAAPYVEGRVEPTPEKVRLIHSAAGQRYRKLENFIEAMKGAPDWLSLDMIVMPNEPDYVAELKAMAESVPSITFREPVPYKELVATLSKYDVSLVFLPPTNFNLKNALPNKFFEAVQARIGLIVGPSPAMAGLVEKYGLGAITEDFSAESLRKTLWSLTPEAIDGWKRAAETAARPLSAESQMAVWETAVKEIAGTR
ncbi:MULTISPECIES: glycosyltransferase family 1 protein [unclassified Arthrobacter]|uniref:glycosyltransferase family 1 protein n=1 Tax=unclassified Arthrobacter TaxID=235627 RepID=UPI00159DD4A3|nr:MULTISPECIES: glycosyltransferase family 1 protein [unclassified Arthrobacter]MCQ9163013.1 glycosyltransferase family 1 protein [Arthrobacter sp. STN4]NVM97469.1 glycosyltransferase family 4 protein [Arthrobacter sp. SDTb3-6]